MRIFGHILAIAIFAIGTAYAQDSAQAEAADDGKVDMNHGKRMFALCVACHGDAGLGNRKFDAPAIAGLPDWYVEQQLVKFRDGVRGAHPDDRAGLLMRPMSRTLRKPTDVKSVAAYVASLTPAEPKKSDDIEGDVEAGETIFTTVCIACHGPDGKGVQALPIKPPPLGHSDDWYLLAQLKKFKAKIRGNDVRDAAGMQMVGIAGTLADEEAMKDVIAYIRTLSMPSE